MCAAASMTAEWRQEYNRRNSMLKNGSYQGAGDVTTRLIREGVRKFVCEALI